MANISFIIFFLISMDMTVLFFCVSGVIYFSRSLLLKLLNARQEVRAKKYLNLINRTVSFLIRATSDFAAIFLILLNLIPKLFIILDSKTEKHCSEITINNLQQYIQYTLVGLSSLAFLDFLSVSCAVARLVKTDILTTIFAYCMPLMFFAMPYVISLCVPKDEIVVTICYRQSVALPNEQVAWRPFLLIYLPVFLVSCIAVLSAHSHLIRMAAQLAVSIFKDSKRGVDTYNSDGLVPSYVTWINIKLDKESTMTTDTFYAENTRMWRKYFLSSKAEMSVPSVWEAHSRFFTYERARLYLLHIIYVACIYGAYYYTENFFHSTELRDISSLIYITILTFNNIARVTVMTHIDHQKEDVICRKIFSKEWKCRRSKCKRFLLLFDGYLFYTGGLEF